MADAAPNPGVIVQLPSEGTRYFACSKICSSNGHKVKVCINKDAAGTCDCPEGTLQAAAAGPAPAEPAGPAAEADVVSRGIRAMWNPTLSTGGFFAFICLLLASCR